MERFWLRCLLPVERVLRRWTSVALKKATMKGCLFWGPCRPIRPASLGLTLCPRPEAAKCTEGWSRGAGGGPCGALSFVPRSSFTHSPSGRPACAHPALTMPGLSGARNAAGSLAERTPVHAGGGRRAGTQCRCPAAKTQSEGGQGAARSSAEGLEPGRVHSQLSGQSRARDPPSFKRWTRPCRAPGRAARRGRWSGGRATVRAEPRGRLGGGRSRRRALQRRRPGGGSPARVPEQQWGDWGEAGESRSRRRGMGGHKWHQVLWAAASTLPRPGPTSPRTSGCGLIWKRHLCRCD